MRKGTKKNRTKNSTPILRSLINRVGYTDTIKDIYTYFIKPLTTTITTEDNLSDCTPNDNFSRLTNFFFRTSRRTLLACRATRYFRLPGVWYAGERTNKRDVPKGALLFVRYDADTADVVEVEYEEQQFRMSAGQWRLIKELVTEVTRVKKSSP